MNSSKKNFASCHLHLLSDFSLRYICSCSSSSRYSIKLLLQLSIKIVSMSDIWKLDKLFDGLGWWRKQLNLTRGWIIPSGMLDYANGIYSWLTPTKHLDQYWGMCAGLILNPLASRIPIVRLFMRPFQLTKFRSSEMIKSCLWKLKKGLNWGTRR